MNQSVHGMYKIKHSSPKNPYSDIDLNTELEKLGYDINHLPDRHVQYHKKDYDYMRFKEIDKNKIDVNKTSVQLWLSENYNPNDDNELTKKAYKFWTNILNRHLHKSKNKHQPLDLIFVENVYRTYPDLMIKCLESDDEYFSRLKYLKSQEDE